MGIRFNLETGTQTSVLILQRKTEQEINQEAIQRNIRDYEIFMAQVHAIGHDKRGNKVYRRNGQGEELLEPMNVTRVEYTAAGQTTARPLPRRKILDDDTPLVAHEFLGWKNEAVLGW